jgi:ribosomal protein S27E
MATPSERLEALAAAGAPSARLVFRCESCGYVLHGRAVGGGEMEAEAARWRGDRGTKRVKCDECGEEAMGLSGVFSEEEWARRERFFVQGG